MRHNAISEMLSTRAQTFEPLFLRTADGGLDVRPWCMGFYTVMKASAARLVAIALAQYN
ncbi:hypothetical protein [Mesorhizobium sp.]|uniref:hypothetical protein n=1 Tax=Mesorhizobium sp. TaxID=1871066 RepID=UPI0032AF4093